LLPITCRRPGTKKKQNAPLFKTMLRKLPSNITAFLRIIEHIMLTQIQLRRRSGFIPLEEEMAAITHRIRQFGTPPNILIIDDSLASGATMAAVVDTIRNIAGPDASIKTAVITVTTPAPRITPDFTLYRYVLCRFPWSLDFKN